LQTLTPIYAGPDDKVISSTVTLSATAQLITGQARDRVAILFSVQSTFAATIGPASLLAGGQGILLNNPTLPQLFTIRDLGQLVTGEWWGTVSPVGGKLVVIEVISKPSKS